MGLDRVENSIPCMELLGTSCCRIEPQSHPIQNGIVIGWHRGEWDVIGVVEKCCQRRSIVGRHKIADYGWNRVFLDCCRVEGIIRVNDSRASNTCKAAVGWWSLGNAVVVVADENGSTLAVGVLLHHIVIVLWEAAVETWGICVGSVVRSDGIWPWWYPWTGDSETSGKVVHEDRHDASWLAPGGHPCTGMTIFIIVPRS